MTMEVRTTFVQALRPQYDGVKPIEPHCGKIIPNFIRRRDIRLRFEFYYFWNAPITVQIVINLWMKCSILLRKKLTIDLSIAIICTTAQTGKQMRLLLIF